MTKFEELYNMQNELHNAKVTYSDLFIEKINENLYCVEDYEGGTLVDRNGKVIYNIAYTHYQEFEKDINYYYKVAKKEYDEWKRKANNEIKKI